MSVTNGLLWKKQDDYSMPKFNPKVKLKPVTEEVLLALQVLFVLNLNAKLVSCVSLLRELLNRSPNAIGSALRSLANLGLIKHYRSGRIWVIELQLAHPFLTSALFRFFGIDDKLLEGKKEDGLELSAQPFFGFLPSIEDCSKYLSLLQKALRQVDFTIAEHQEWLAWVDRVEHSIADMKKVAQGGAELEDDNPIRVFAEDILSRIKKKEALRANKLNFNELAEVVSEVLTDYREVPPWVDEVWLQSQNTMLDDFLREKFYGLQEK